MTQNRELFEKTPVVKALMSLAVPTIASQLVSMIYNLADTFFIGMTNDDSKIAASGVAFVLVFAMNALSNLFGVGGSSLISRLLGERRDGDAARVSSFSFWGSFVISAIYSLLIFAFMEPFLYFLGATDTSIAYAKDYAFWVVVVGAIPTTLMMTLSHLIRSEGYAKEAGAGLAIGSVLNIILDPIFMFVILEPGREVMGAAIATMIANVVSLVYFLITLYLIKRRGASVLSINPKKVIPEKHHIMSVFAVGFPSALGSMLACLSSIMLNNLTASYKDIYGDVPVAAVTIAKKIDMLPMNVGMGLCQGMMPLVAYNYAAKNYKRMKAFSDAARTIGIIFAIVCIAVFEIFAEPIVRIFVNNAEIVNMATKFLRIMCLAVPLMITNFQMSFTFQAMGMGKQSLLLSSLRQGLINIPLLFLMNSIFQLDGIIWTQLISDILTAIISFTVYYKCYTKLVKSSELDG